MVLLLFLCRVDGKVGTVAVCAHSLAADDRIDASAAMGDCSGALAMVGASVAWLLHRSCLQYLGGGRASGYLPVETEEEELRVALYSVWEMGIVMIGWKNIQINSIDREKQA